MDTSENEAKSPVEVLRINLENFYFSAHGGFSGAPVATGIPGEPEEIEGVRFPMCIIRCDK